MGGNGAEEMSYGFMNGFLGFALNFTLLIEAFSTKMHLFIWLQPINRVQHAAVNYEEIYYWDYKSAQCLF